MEKDFSKIDSNRTLLSWMKNLPPSIAVIRSWKMGWKVENFRHLLKRRLRNSSLCVWCEWKSVASQWETIGLNRRNWYLKSWAKSWKSCFNVEVDNSEKSLIGAIPALATNLSGVRNTENEFQLREQSFRLHLVAKHITFWKWKSESGALDIYRTVEATAK